MVEEGLLIRIHPAPHEAVEEWCIAKQLDCCLVQLVIIDGRAFVCIGEGQPVRQIKHGDA